MNVSILKRLQKIEDHLLKQTSLRLKEAQQIVVHLERQIEDLLSEQAEQALHVAHNPEDYSTFEVFDQEIKARIKEKQESYMQQQGNIDKILSELHEHFTKQKIYQILK